MGYPNWGPTEGDFESLQSCKAVCVPGHAPFPPTPGPTPLPTPPTPPPTPTIWKCMPGQGGLTHSDAMQHLISQTVDNTQESCETLCNMNKDCVTFDFAPASSPPEKLSTACRLFNSLASRDQADSGRSFCTRDATSSAVRFI